jgi:hypothetical protein
MPRCIGGICLSCAATAFIQHMIQAKQTRSTQHETTSNVAADARDNVPTENLANTAYDSTADVAAHSTTSIASTTSFGKLHFAPFII